MSNAQEVLAQLTNTWSSMLDKFYDSVSDEYIKWMAKEYEMDLKTLREKAAPLKAKLLSKATEAVSAVKTTRKQAGKAKIVDSSKYGTMSRKEIVELCKTHGLPVKRKNQDMIDQLKKIDENEAAKSLDVHQTSDESSDVEPELEPEPEPEPKPATNKKPKIVHPKQSVKKTTKQSKPTPPLKNELLEEPLSSDDEDED